MTGLKKNLNYSIENKRILISPHDSISIQRQCELLEISRASYYYEPKPESEKTLLLMRKLDELYLLRPFYGARKMAFELGINRKQASRLMRLMGLSAIYQKPRLSVPGTQSLRFPYLLRNVSVDRPNQVWSSDITYIPIKGGFLYLVAIIDWFSRYVLAWELSNSMESSFCCDTLIRALKIAKPDIFNNDQGSQFTCEAFVKILTEANIKISWDGKGRALDNVFVERLWRNLKYEEVYLNDYRSGLEAWTRIDAYFQFYNNQRIHQSLDYGTPSDFYLQKEWVS